MWQVKSVGRKTIKQETEQQQKIKKKNVVRAKHSHPNIKSQNDLVKRRTYDLKFQNILSSSGTLFS